MAHEVDTAEAPLTLPLLVVGPIDLGRLLRELEALDNAIVQANLKGVKDIKMPKTSKLLDQTLILNKLDLMNETDRKKILFFLMQIRQKAPVIHISFSADPSPLFVDKLMGWLRKEIHPQLLMTIGLQPNLGAGCVVRTSNKYFDFSLREFFNKRRDMLIKQLQQSEAQG